MPGLVPAGQAVEAIGQNAVATAVGCNGSVLPQQQTAGTVGKSLQAALAHTDG